MENTMALWEWLKKKERKKHNNENPVISHPGKEEKAISGRDVK